MPKWVNYHLSSFSLLERTHSTPRSITSRLMRQKTCFGGFFLWGHFLGINFSPFTSKRAKMTEDKHFPSKVKILELVCFRNCSMDLNQIFLKDKKQHIIFVASPKHADPRWRTVPF